MAGVTFAVAWQATDSCLGVDSGWSKRVDQTRGWDPHGSAPLRQWLVGEFVDLVSNVQGEIP